MGMTAVIRLPVVNAPFGDERSPLVGATFTGRIPVSRATRSGSQFSDRLHRLPVLASSTVTTIPHL